MTRVRVATEHDWTGVMKLLGELHPKAAGSLRPDRVRQGARSFVAREDGEPIGFALATFVDYGSSYGTVEELVVDAAHRRRGVGRALLDACRAWLTEEGVELVFVSAYSEALSFYERQGFVRCSGAWLYWEPSGRAISKSRE